MKRNWLFVFGLLLFSCKKDKIAVEYKGEVIRAVTDCSVATEVPYIIKYTFGNVVDSFITASLPSAFHASGSKILFKMRDNLPSNEAMVCITSIITPIQKSIYEVKLQ